MPRYKTKWSNAKIIEEIKKLDEAGEPLTVKHTSKNYSALYSAALRYFHIDYGAIRRASRREAIRKITKWNKKRVIQEIKKIPKKDLWFIYKTNVALHSAARREFGSWKKAVEAAGYDYEEINELADTTYTSWTKERIVRMIRELPPERLSYRNMTKEYLLLYSAAYRKFGNWANALRVAGIDEEIIGKCFKNKKWTSEAILKEIRERYRQGKKLSSGYMQKHYPSLFSAAYRRFGSWGEAIDASGLDYRTIIRNKAHT
jgi:hypothetical protein